MAGLKLFEWFRQHPKRVPVIMQMESVECGAASLGMIMAYHGKWVPLEQLRQDCGVSRDGSNMLSIVKAARQYGFEVKGARVDIDSLHEIKTPAIIHWNFNHFVTFNGIRGNKVYMNDPGAGRISESLETFDKSFTGIVVEVKPGPDFVPGGKQASVLGFILNRLRGTSNAFFFVMISGLVVSLLGLFSPLLSQIFMDEIITHRTPEWVIPFFVLMGVILLAQCVVQLLNGFKWPQLDTRLSTMASARFMWHVLHLPLSFFQMRYTGDLVARLTSNQTIATNLIAKIAPTLTNLALMALYLFVLIRYSVPILLVGVVAIILNFATMRYIADRQMNLSRVLQRHAGKFQSVSMNSIEGMEVIKAAGAEVGFFQWWAGHFAAKVNHEVKTTRIMSLLGLVPILVGELTGYAILMLGAYLIIKGDLTVGMLMACQGFIGMLSTPLNNLMQMGMTMIETRTLMERVEDVYRYERDVPDPDFDETLEGAGKLSGMVDVRNLTFGYSQTSPPVIKNVSFSVKPGKSVAFVGSSGCGKSTIARLLTGLYKPWEGEILFDGKSIADIPRSVFVNSVAMVNQDILLFDDTIANNVKMWDKSIEDFAMVMACNDAEIYREIVQRPEGFNGKLAEGGRNLSGGQRQRLEIASVLMCEPMVLVLDEATSSLDTLTEERVMQNIQKMGISLIIVAHRLSTIRNCDEIIVLDEGEVVERGTHDELMARGGKYSELHKNS